MEESQKEKDLAATLKRLADAEPGPKFFGFPERWWEAHKRRCPNDHVSRLVLKSERLGRDACLACSAHLYLTFPEDEDGPLRVAEFAEATEG